MLASSGRAFICITDRKVSFPGFSADYMALKNDPSFGRCVVLSAGDDTQYIPIILESAKKSLAGSGFPSPREVAEAVDEAYEEEVSELIEKRVLKRYGFDTESFRKSGKKLCTEVVYNRLCERMSNVKVSIKFLICGFDDDGGAHIYSAGGDGSVEGYDHVGVWAIGDGAEMALAALSFHMTHRHVNPPWAGVNESLAAALSAKFMAESSNSVGEGTLVAIHEFDKTPLLLFSPANISILRDQWLKDCALKLSDGLLGKLSQCIEKENPTQSDAQT
jgi:hypothetical protein